jgi:4-hydroxy-tetrahydrodipicolinate synthase
MASEPHASVQHQSVFEGVFSVVPTPFDPSGTIDFDKLGQTVQFLMSTGVNGLVALGVTSETNRLNDREKLEVLERVFTETHGRLPIVVGANTDGLLTSVELSRHAKQLGAIAVMAGPPRTGRANSDGIVRYFAELSAAADIQVVVQDYPAFSGFAMEPQLLVRLMRELQSVRAIKLEDPPTAPKIAEVRRLAGEACVPIFGGLGGAFLFEELLAGAAGAMTGFAYPEILLHVTKAYREGDVTEARNVFYRYAPVVRLEAQESLGMAIRKEFLRRRGIIEHAGLRQPGSRIDDTTRKAIDSILAWSELSDPKSKLHPWN